MQPTSVYSSNSIRLSWREWAAAALVSVGVLCLLPALWPATGTNLSRPDYRLPGELSEDYWMFGSWSKYSRAKYQAVVLGDSVVWGQYVRSGDTLTHHLNELAGQTAFANLGVDGLHPAAMAGMIAYYGREVEHEPVLLHLNPLWMSSSKQDLQAQGEARFNHPKLVPQLLQRPTSYRPTPAEVIGAVLPRHLPFLNWKEHVRISYLEGMGPQEWTLEHPYSLFPESRGPDAFSGDEPGSQPQSWREKGLAPQNLPWLEPARSYQWRSFKRAVALLRSRGNDVFVVVGPFNSYALTGESQTRYQALTSAIEKWLEQEKVPYCAPRLPSTDMYADASHPLGGGYRELAKELFRSPAFRAWMRSWAGAGDRPARRNR
jgi:hypothetical protein